MKRINIFSLTCIVVILIISEQTSLLSSQNVTTTQVIETDFQKVIGSWQGTLTYLDYSSNKTVRIPATIDIQQLGRKPRFTFANSFPKEPHVKWIDTLIISSDSLMIGDEKILSREVVSDGTTRIQTEMKGVDGNDNKPALFRFTYILGYDVFAKRKEVQFVGTNEWIERHEYRYTARSRMLAPADMKHDIAIVRATWENVHPGLYRYNTPKEIDKAFKQIDLATKDTLEQRHFFILLSQLAVKLHCGHTFVSYYNTKRITKGNLYSRIFLPVMFRVIDSKCVITHTLDNRLSIKAGDELIAINGVPMKIIIDSLLTVSKADGKNGRNKQLDNITIYPRDISVDRYCLFDIFHPLFFKQNINDEEYTLKVKSLHNTTRVVQCKGLSKQERYELYIKKYGELPQNEDSWYIKEYSPTTALFRLGDFATYRWKFNFKQYLDSVFTLLKKKGYKNLIVDIRQNEGGADEARDGVLSYLTAKPIGCANPIRKLYRSLRVNDSLHQYLDTWDDNFKKPKSNDDYIAVEQGYFESRKPDDECIEIKSNPNHFTGKIYLITDATNSSATFIMADAVKRNKLATIVGETTGGTQQGINGGELFFLYLPHSKMEMDIPLIYQAPRYQRPDDGIHPDVEVKTTVRDITTNHDPQVEYILNKLIRK
jgi:hypothetical protein